MTLPDRLSAALSPHQPGAGITEHPPAGRKIVQQGDICRVGPYFGIGDAVRLALVLTVDPDENSTEIMLVHPYVELATESDLVFSPDEVGMPYPIVVETGAHSAVWTRQQILERVGRLPEEALREIARVALADDPFTVSPRTGLPLAGPVDSRWAFTLQEVEAINQLAADRLSVVFDDSPWRIDPGLLSPLLISQHHDPLSFLVELDFLRMTRSVVMEIEDIDMVNDLDLDVWIGYLGSDLGREFCRDFFTSLQPLIDNSFQKITDKGFHSKADNNVRWLPERDSKACNLSPGNCGRLITAAHLWKGEPAPLKAVHDSNGSELINDYEVVLVA